MSIDNGGPAFPGHVDENARLQAANNMRHIPSGMTLRDYFAAKALPVIIDKLCFEGLYREECKGDSIGVAHAAYKLADAMLKARG